MNPFPILLDATALSALDPNVTLILDCRFDLADPTRGERDWRQGHLPGARYANLDRDLSDVSRPGLGRHPLPDAEAFARSLARWGWTRGRHVVAYDDNGGALAAARAWWLLRLVGIEASVLDGGWNAWRAAGLPVAAGEPKPAATSTPKLHFDTEQVLYYEAFERLRAQPGTLLLDARAAPRYRGEVEPLDARAGHVPGARNRPFADNLDATGCFKSAAVLRAEYAALLGGRDPRAVIHMCGSGVTAAHNLLAMGIAGLHGSRLFAPSWSGWSSDPSRPLATGEEA